jgi:hypothetical protein
LSVIARPYPGYFYRREDHDRLIRDGWRVQSGEPKYTGPTGELLVYQKPIDQEHTLEMHIENSMPTMLTKTVYRRRLEGGSTFDLMADWADVRNGCLYFSQGGRLLQLCSSELGKANNGARTLADFTNMKFEEVATPEWAVQW